MIVSLKLNNQEISECTVRESTNRYSKQYRCGTTLYVLSYVSSKYKITIDRMIGTPGHGKDVVDSTNVCDKRYLKGKMCMFGTPEADNCNKRMMTHSMISNVHYSFADECKRLCEYSDKENETKAYSKY